MASLERNLRKDLEKTVKSARRVAEAGARKAVAQLGTGEAEAPKHLSADQRTLRNRLRAHGRQLGDRRDPKTGVQDTARLVQECAYEHWHRMLFARFLAETDLLIEPESGVAITLDEVQELAREKATDWLELASDYAERMLPQIFRKDDPVLQIALPPETRSEMEDLLKSLSKPVFEADDSLGWVYQFWQAEKKDEVNKSEVKIGADELPAVTQLFTEDYMVLFLLHNTLGAWWAGKVLADKPSLAASAPDELALRAASTVGDIDWTYLRFVRDKAEDGTEGPWRPAAGTYESWPKTAKELTVLDPCMGSGHFLVFALPILVALRMAEEGLSQSAAVDAVLKDNLFGLEIDPRCTQIAAFNLAFAAWRKVGHRPLPQLNLACSGLAIGVTKAEWLKLAEKAVMEADPAAKRDLFGVEKNLLTVGLEERVKNGLETLYDLFAQAPWLGIASNNHPATASRLRDAMGRAGVEILDQDQSRMAVSSEVGGWTESGKLDALGHSLDALLVRQIDPEIDALLDRITALLSAGWSRVRVVTDHGWLLLPGGLPKVELSPHLVATKWSRCAAVKGGSTPSIPTYPWYWNPVLRIASPPGIGAFLANTEYAHGGISLQECVIPDLVVERGEETVTAAITEINWRGMRCRVAVKSNAVGLQLDLRLNWKQPTSSIAASAKELGKIGEASLAVSDDKHEGAAASVVVLDASGRVLDYKPTTVGEES